MNLTCSLLSGRCQSKTNVPRGTCLSMRPFGEIFPFVAIFYDHTRQVKLSSETVIDLPSQAAAIRKLE